MATFEEFAAELEAANTNSAPEDNGTPAAEQASEVSADGATHESETAQPTQFDLDAYGDQIVKVKVDGQELEVPVRELQSGYMRQADYTRKTQEAAEARRLWDAFQADPQTTLEILGRYYTQGADPAQGDVAGAEDDGLDPEFVAMRSELAEMRQWRADQEMAERMGRLQNTYGDAFNAREVATEALRRNTADVEAVFLQMQGQKALARQAALNDDAARRAAEDQRARAAQQNLAATSTATPSAAGAGDAPTDFADLDAAVRAAWRVAS